LSGVLNKETTRDWGICVETDLQLVEEGKEVFFDVSGDRVIIPLENGWENRPCSRLNVVDFLDIGRSEVGESELARTKVSYPARHETGRGIHTLLNLPAAYSSWIAASVSSTGVVGSGACR
jgi:hypothetical protein